MVSRTAEDRDIYCQVSRHFEHNQEGREGLEDLEDPIFHRLQEVQVVPEVLDCQGFHLNLKIRDYLWTQLHPCFLSVPEVLGVRPLQGHPGILEVPEVQEIQSNLYDPCHQHLLFRRLFQGHLDLPLVQMVRLDPEPQSAPSLPFHHAVPQFLLAQQVQSGPKVPVVQEGQVVQLGHRSLFLLVFPVLRVLRPTQAVLQVLVLHLLRSFQVAQVARCLPVRPCHLQAPLGRPPHVDQLDLLDRFLLFDPELLVDLVHLEDPLVQQDQADPAVHRPRSLLGCRFFHVHRALRCFQLFQEIQPLQSVPFPLAVLLLLLVLRAPLGQAARATQEDLARLLARVRLCRRRLPLALGARSVRLFQVVLLHLFHPLVQELR